MTLSPLSPFKLRQLYSPSIPPLNLRGDEGGYVLKLFDQNGPDPLKKGSRIDQITEGRTQRGGLEKL